jgi:hypothetical protein
LGGLYGANHWAGDSKCDACLFKLGGLYAVVAIGCGVDIPFNLQM